MILTVRGMNAVDDINVVMKFVIYCTIWVGNVGYHG
jgi:hypothetical protein